jgi:hypothetical protein
VTVGAPVIDAIDDDLAILIGEPASGEGNAKQDG